MSNRPHSREKRVNDEHVSADKHSFNSQYDRGYVGGSNRNLSSTIGIIALLVSLFKRKNNNNNTYGRKKSSLLGKLVKIIIIIVVLYYIFNFVSTLFSNVSNTIHNASNNFIQNHQIVYDSNTSSDNSNLVVNNSNAREKFTKIIGNGEDDVTVMVYMIGTDLESSYGCASNDLQEMNYADINGNLNVVIETGGCNKWNNNVVSSKAIQRYALNSEGFFRLQDNVGNEAMTSPDVLTDFIKYSADNFPANRYMLILWDHGGGSVTGYGYDEKFPYAGSISPDEVGKALKDSGVKFDFVGFDACLMANLETALAIEPYADYLIGSEETEPGGGWDYTGWLNALDNNTSISTVELSKIIIDDYVADSRKTAGNSAITQSIIDLGELVANISTPIQTFSKATANKLESDQYNEIAIARGNTKEFSKSANLDQVDLIDLANKFDVDGSKELVKGIKSAIKYNKTANINNAYGISAYFPYSSLSKMNEMVKIYNNINIDEEYTNVVKSFATFASSGQIATQYGNNSSTSLFDILMDNNYYNDYSYSSDDYYDIFNNAYGNSGYNSYGSIFGNGYDNWLDSSMLNLVSNYFGRGKIVDSKELNVIEKDGQRVVSLDEQQWSLIDNVLLNIFVDDGEGYIDLGLDNVFDWTNDGDLIVDSDGTWLTLNNHLVSYYMVSDEYVNENNYQTIGKIPAYLNGQRVDIMVSFTPEHPYGLVEGAKLVYEDSDSQQKGLIEINDGDEIKFVCNYYTYDGKFVDEYKLGDTLIISGDLELYNSYVDENLLYAYCFKDVYGNKLWTPISYIN